MKSLLLLFIFLVSPLLVINSYAEEICYSFTGKLRKVDDRGNLLVGTELKKNSEFTGNFCYETEAAIIPIPNKIKSPLQTVYTGLGQTIDFGDGFVYTGETYIAVSDFENSDILVVSSSKLPVTSPIKTDNTTIKIRLSDHSKKTLSGQYLPENINYKDISTNLMIVGKVGRNVDRKSYLLSGDLESLILIGDDAQKNILANIYSYPKSININKNNSMITAYIELPKEYYIEDISSDFISVSIVNGFVLENPIYSEGTSEIGDQNNNGIKDLKVNFPHQDLIKVLGTGKAEIVINGELNDDTLFQGYTSIQLVN